MEKLYIEVCVLNKYNAFQHNVVTTQEWRLTKEQDISKSYLRNVSQHGPL